MNKARKQILIGLGSFVFFVILLELGLRLGGCLYLQKMLSGVRTEARGASLHTILSIGDSYTVGGQGSWEDSYPSQLQKSFFDNYLQDFTIINGGICEANSSQALQHLSKLIDNYGIDSVILLVGSANRFNPSGYYSSKWKNMISGLRLYKVIKILTVNLKGKILQGKAKKYLTKKRKVKYDHVYNETGGYRAGIDACSEEDKMRYKDAVTLAPNQSKGYYQLGECYIERREFAKAEMLYKKMISKNIDPVGAHLELGSCYEEQQKYKEAEIIFKGLIEKASNNVSLYVELARNYVKQKEYEKSEVLLKQALSLNYNQGSVYNAWGHYYIAQGKDGKAVAMFKKALTMNPDDETFGELAWVYIRQGKFSEALDMLIKVIELYPEEFLNYYALLKAYELQSKYDAGFILKLFSKIEAKTPELKKNKTFQDYVSFFRNKGKMEKKINHWLERDLEKIVTLCKENNIQLVIQNYPYPYFSVNRILKDVAIKHSLPFVDNYAAFNKLAAHDKEKYFSDFDHCTKAGHRIMADNIYKVLVAEGIVNPKGFVQSTARSAKTYE